MKMTVTVIAVFCLFCSAVVHIIHNKALQTASDSRVRISPVMLVVAGLTVILDLIASDQLRTSSMILDMMPTAFSLWLLTSSLWESDHGRRLVIGFFVAGMVLCMYHLLRLCGLFPEPRERHLIVILSLMTVLVCCLLVYGFVIRLMDVKTVMKLGTVWMIVTLSVDVVYVLFFIVSTELVQIGVGSIALLMFTGLIVAMEFRIMTDSEFIIWRKRERIIIESMKVTSVTSNVDGSRIDAVYHDLYERITALFEAEKPYLDNNLTINDIVRKLYSNKLYISRAISQFTGRNFCQFVNYYRIMHSIDCFRSNPEFKIHELATQSGFNTIVSYNMAFRLFMGENPSDWCRREKINIIKKKK